MFQDLGEDIPAGKSELRLAGADYNIQFPIMEQNHI